jgi:outer membrane lipoprotein SlyB
MWVAAVAVIVLSLAGVGAITGVIPSVGSKPGDATPATPVAPPPLAVAPAPVPVQEAIPAHPVEKKHHSYPQQAAAAPTLAQAAPPPVAAPQPPLCHDCGTIEAINQVEVKGEGTGIGAVGGAVVGGLVGSNLGGGHGKDAMTLLGAVGGGFAGHEIEKNVRKKVRYQIVVRFDDGTSRTFTQDQAPSWRSGDRIRLRDGQLAAL